MENRIASRWHYCWTLSPPALCHHHVIIDQYLPWIQSCIGVSSFDQKSSGHMTPLLLYPRKVIGYFVVVCLRRQEHLLLFFRMGAELGFVLRAAQNKDIGYASTKWCTGSVARIAFRSKLRFSEHLDVTTISTRSSKPLSILSKLLHLKTFVVECSIFRGSGTGFSCAGTATLVTFNVAFAVFLNDSDLFILVLDCLVTSWVVAEGMRKHLEALSRESEPSSELNAVSFSKKNSLLQ